MGKRPLFPLIPPLMNAAGMLGYVPSPQTPLPAAAAFVTAPISLRPRTPAHPPRLYPVPGGVLLHTGLPNPGWRAVRQQYAPRWAAAPRPVVVHLLGTEAAEVRYMVWEIEGLAGVEAIELGLPPDCTPEQAEGLVHAARGELPLIVQLPRTQAVAIAQRLKGMEDIAAFSLAPPRGTLRLPDGRLLSGRLYGPAVLPHTLWLVQTLHAAVETPVLAAGGVYSPADVTSCLQAGAAAVQLDTVLWCGSWPIASHQEP